MGKTWAPTSSDSTARLVECSKRSTGPNGGRLNDGLISMLSERSSHNSFRLLVERKSCCYTRLPGTSEQRFAVPELE
jgi:hypothetical protein